MERRSFLVQATAAAAALGLPASVLAAEAKPGRTLHRRTIKPKVLKPGDTVGIVAPASFVEKEAELEEARKTMEGLGLKTVLSAQVSDN